MKIEVSEMKTFDKSMYENQNFKNVIERVVWNRV